MSDDYRDEKEEQMEVFEDILKSQYKLRTTFHDMVIKFCNRTIKILNKRLGE